MPYLTYSTYSCICLEPSVYIIIELKMRHIVTYIDGGQPVQYAKFLELNLMRDYYKSLNSRHSYVSIIYS